MNEILRTLNGCWIPSVSGRVEYQVTVRPGESVTRDRPISFTSIVSASVVVERVNVPFRFGFITF